MDVFAKILRRVKMFNVEKTRVVQKTESQDANVWKDLEEMVIRAPQQLLKVVTQLTTVLLTLLVLLVKKPSRIHARVYQDTKVMDILVLLNKSKRSLPQKEEKELHKNAYWVFAGVPRDTQPKRIRRTAYLEKKQLNIQLNLSLLVKVRELILVKQKSECLLQ